jgi:3'-phosphoadenosine 5'-phosphosulfate sulfotransferase (PAPS reductase)/FAD synthetase
VTYRYIARCSYGNDSIAMLQYMHECGLKDVAVVNNDTGWASEAWADRVAEGEAWARSMGWDAITLTSDGFESVVINQTEAGMFPTRQRKFCTKYLKIHPFLAWAKVADPEKRALVCVGVRRAESVARSKHPAFMPEKDDGRHVWHPLIDFSDADRDAMIAKTPLPILPHRSDECAICINSNRADLRRALPREIERAAGEDSFIPAPGEERDWLIAQLIEWPTRVDPDRTTNCSFLMQSGARTIAALLSHATRQAEREKALREALDWALAELRGATRYDNDQQRDNCFVKADQALSNSLSALDSGSGEA